MKVVIVGLGIQGQKRRHHAGEDYFASVDPVNLDADYKSIEDVPLADYDAALCCVPDAPKIDLLNYLFENGKHALVEKPLFAADEEDLKKLEALAKQKRVVSYTAYNHRFEPHFVRMRDLISSNRLGKIYHCRMFYGNGTARLVRDSAWRDTGSGVLPDLGSHLLDTAAFWFGDLGEDFSVVSARNHENFAPDHVIFASTKSRTSLEMEMTLLMWRNYFTCDIFAEKGTAHITSLCKWGPTTFTTRMRILPSGRPPEESQTLIQEDPTWAAEYAHFKHLIQSGTKSCMRSDIWLNRLLGKLGLQAIEIASR